MAASGRPAQLHAIFGKQPQTRRVDADATVLWGCSMKGWNCCVDRSIPVYPYDMVRLRHALGRPSADLIDDGTVSFAWSPADGSLLGSLPHRPYGAGQSACVFLDVITNLDAREMQEREPERFESMPGPVQRSADSTTGAAWDVAALCRVHTSRPEACRAFPYQRVATLNPDGAVRSAEVHEVSRCGTCAFSTPTTPRAVLEDESIDEFWRARSGLLQVANYLHSLGVANVDHPGYRAYAVDAVARLWTQLFMPDEDEQIAAVFPDQWREPEDIEGDRAIHRILLEHAMDRADALVAASGESPSAWGRPGEQRERPVLDALTDRATPVPIEIEPPLRQAS